MPGCPCPGPGRDAAPFALCVPAGRRGQSQSPPPRPRPLPGGSWGCCAARPPERGRFPFLRQLCEEGYLFRQPQGKPFGQTVSFKQFTSLVFKQTPTRPLGLVAGRGRPFLLLAHHRALRPPPGGPRPGLLLRSDLGRNSLGDHWWAVALARGLRVQAMGGLSGARTGWALDRASCSLPAGLGRSSWCPGLCIFLISLAKLKEEPQRLCSQRGVNDPPSESINTHQCLPAFDHWLSHRGFFLRDSDNGGP